MSYIERHRRSLLKTLTFRFLVILVDSILVFAFTKRYDLTFGFVILSNLPRAFLYYFHERLWARTDWGKDSAARTTARPRL